MNRCPSRVEGALAKRVLRYGMVQPIHADSVEIRPLRRREYERLVELGEFERERVELVRGAIVRMSPSGSRHAEAVARLLRILVTSVGDRAVTRAQSPLAIADDSEPEPDLALVPPGDYSDAHPREALLVVEVADTSLDYDRLDKARLYAEAGAKEYWIVNLADDAIEVHRGAREDGRWTEIAIAGAGESVVPVAFPDIIVGVDDIVPWRG